MQFLTSILLAASVIMSVGAQDVNVVGAWTDNAADGDVNVVGSHSTPAAEVAPANPSPRPMNVTPDISVVGAGTIDAAPAPDVSVVGEWSYVANDDYATHTRCFETVQDGGSTATVEVSPTLVDGVSPYGVNCQIVYRSGGGVVMQPLPQAPAPSSSNKGITIVLPVVLSIVGFLGFIVGILVFLRIRSRRKAMNNRDWVNRKGGWANGNEDRESGMEARTRETDTAEIGKA